MVVYMEKCELWNIKLTKLYIDKRILSIAAVESTPHTVKLLDSMHAHLRPELGQGVMLRRGTGGDVIDELKQRFSCILCGRNYADIRSQFGLVIRLPRREPSDLAGVWMLSEKTA